jgi:hypothetical protein
MTFDRLAAGNAQSVSQFHFPDRQPKTFYKTSPLSQIGLAGLLEVIRKRTTKHHRILIPGSFQKTISLDCYQFFFLVAYLPFGFQYHVERRLSHTANLFKSTLCDDLA